MEEYNDIKRILTKHKNNIINLKQTFDEINTFINDNGFYTGIEMKISFEQGENGEENDVTPNNNILEKFINDDTIDNFVNHIAHVGFFTKDDIKNVYHAGKININNDKLNGDILYDVVVQGFKQYLITNYNDK